MGYLSGENTTSESLILVEKFELVHIQWSNPYLGNTIDKSIIRNQSKGTYREMLKYHSLRDKVFSLKNLYAAFKHALDKIVSRAGSPTSNEASGFSDSFSRARTRV